MKAGTVLLRPLRAVDAKGYWACHQDKEAKRNFKRVPSSIKEAEKEILEDRRYTKRFAVMQNGQFVGFVNLRTNNDPMYKHSAIIGFGILKRFRGQGLASRAVKEVVTFGFKRLRLHRISGTCRSFNKASARVMENAGLKHEGTLRKNKFMRGRFFDDEVFALVR